MRRDLFICLALACLTVLLFAPAREHELISYDDKQYALDPHVQRGLTPDGTAWAFTTLSLPFYWHPVTWLSLMADVQFFGGGAGTFHLTNILLHAANAALVYLLLRRATGLTWPALVVAAIWAVHPLRVQSVAWVADRKGLLSAFFSLLALLAYVRYARRGSRSAYAAAIVASAFALMSKPMAVTIPLAMLLMDAWPLERTIPWRRLLVEKAPFFLLALAAGIVTLVAQRQGGAMKAIDVYPPGLRAANAVWSYGRYLMLTLWPRGLTIFYPYEGAVPGTALPMLKVLAAGGALIAITILCALLWRRGLRAAMVGWVWFLVTLIPTIGLVQVGSQAMADRFTYVPHIGLLAGIVFTAAELIRGRRGLNIASLAAAVLICATSAALAQHELGYWRNDLTLFGRSLEVTRFNHTAHNCLAFALAERGEVRAAENHYRQSMQIQPNHPDAPMNLANLLGDAGRMDESIELYRRAVGIAPHNALIHYNFGLTLARNGREAEALPHLAEAVRLAPDDASARYAYALALHSQGQADQAGGEMSIARSLAQKQRLAGLLGQIDRAAPASQPAH